MADQNKSTASTDSSSSSQTRNPCAICLEEMSPGAGSALFMAECSHTFHFRCIALSAQHGNITCPLCKVPWRQLPFQPQKQPQVPAPVPPTSRHISQHQVANTDKFDDDEPLSTEQAVGDAHRTDTATGVDVRSYTEYKAIERLKSQELNILIHLEAPALFTSSDTGRAPIDLVAVLDVSYSMHGKKVQLLKQAMNFVVKCLQPSDRLSIISFSHDARRQLPLRRMTPVGKVSATQAVTALHVVGNTNIADGLIKGARVMEERRQSNPVSGVLFLSDGRDNCSFLSRGPENISRLPPSIIGSGATHRIPVHAFGFGSDHDAALMSSIAEASGGTFSFIQAERDIQDAFAQCIGGLMSVAFQNVGVMIKCADPGVHIVGAMKSGTYANSVEENRRAGSIIVGDMYAGESRDFILRVNVPKEAKSDTTKLLYVRTAHREPVSRRTVESMEMEVCLKRPVLLANDDRIPCPEVEQQKRRYEASDTMAAAQAAADKGQYREAVSLLANCRQRLFHGRTDELSAVLDAEMREMQKRLGDRVSYEKHGRAYVLAGISSHRQQRATARSAIPTFGSFNNRANTGLVASPYQTRVMTEMVCRSQASASQAEPEK